MNLKARIKKIFKGKLNDPNAQIFNLYRTNYDKKVLISYLTTPFFKPSEFKHQNYLTSHIVAETFASLGYNVDVVFYLKKDLFIDYGGYDVIFGLGDNFERSFHHTDRTIPRVHLITGAHQDLHNSMSLKSLKDFYELSGVWLPQEANVQADSAYYSMYNADATIILAEGLVLEDCAERHGNRPYSLNNNILGVFAEFVPKTVRTRNFLFLSGGKQITKGLALLLEFARLRSDLHFFVVVPGINAALEFHYRDVLTESGNVSLFKDLSMTSPEMKQIVEKCAYVVAPSYIDGMPGGTLEPMSAGLVPIVSPYCGFGREPFIFEMKQLSVDGLSEAIENVLELDDETYFEKSRAVKAYTKANFSADSVKDSLKKILEEVL